MLFARRLDLAVRGMQGACALQLTSDHVKKRAAILDDVVDFGRAIVASDLQESKLNYFLELRALAAEAKFASAYIVQNSVMFPHWEDQFRDMSEGVKKLLLAICN